MLALLSLDAYSRGVNAKLQTKSGLALDEQIGTFTWQLTSDDMPGASAVGFSASSYTLSDGETVIAYRGTDLNFDSVDGALGSIFDVLTGWTSSFGVFGSDVSQIKLQPYYAENFYELVTNKDLHTGEAVNAGEATLSNVIITGHSLGGSLAGYIGSLSHSETVIFNEIPYLGLALTSAINDFLGPLVDPTDVQNLTNQLVDLLNGDAEILDGFNLPTGSNITSYRTFGEIAEAARILGPFLGVAAANYMPPIIAQPEALAAAALIYGATADYQQTLNYLSSNSGFPSNPINLHSQELMVLLTYAESESHVAWASVGSQLLDTLFGDEVANIVGVQQFGGYGTASAKLMGMLAYSVLDDGNLIFGNTGVRALFNDADQLGSIATADILSGALEDALPGLMQAVVQFAGLMAIREINFSDYTEESSLFDPLAGIIELSDLAGNIITEASNAAVLSLNINQDLWQIGKTDSEPEQIEILGIKTIIDDALSEFADDEGANSLGLAVQFLYWNTNDDFSLTDTISKIQYYLSDGPIALALESDVLAYDRYHASLIGLSDENDTVHGNDQNNIILGADGDDTLYGGLGSDLLVGGDGDDVFIDSVTQRSGDNRQNEDDVYVGSHEYTNLWDNFVNWLATGTETDTVRYTIDNLRPDDLETDEDESRTQIEGVTITDISTKLLGNTQVVEIVIEDDRTKLHGTDLLLGIERVELSDRADTVKIDKGALSTAILIDMGKSGRVESELPEGETLPDNALMTNVDVADYSAIGDGADGHGLIYINGVTHEHSDVWGQNGNSAITGLTEEVEAINDYASGGLLGFNDKLHVEGADKIILTDRDDVLISADYGTIVYTGDGYDKIWFQNGVAIADLSANDRISLFGLFTLGGIRNGWSEDPYAYGGYGTRYGLNKDGELIIENKYWTIAHKDADGELSYETAKTYILNFSDTLHDVGDGQLGAGNIFLLEYKMQTVLFRDIAQDQIGKASAVGAGAFDLIGWAMKIMSISSWFGGEDPLVLDLDGDGVELTALDRANNHFDIDGDLYAEATGFVGGDDGVLARDINGNGVIDSADEMFGKGQTSGFEMLKALDGNHDGVVNAADNGLADFNGDGVVNGADTFDKLLVWQDADQDRRTDVGELKSVTQWGITSFDVPSEIVAPGDAENPTVINGNIVNQTASFTTSDGESHVVADVTFKVENQTTNYVGPEITVSASVSDLADLKGYGTLVSLHEAMSLRPESEADFKAAVAALNTPDLSQLRALAQPVLEAWALGSPIKINGQVQTGIMAAGDYDDMIFIKNGSQIADYTTSISDITSAGQTVLEFASGAQLTITLSGYSPSMTSEAVQQALRDLLNDYFSEEGGASLSVTGPNLSATPPDKSIHFNGNGGSIVLNDFTVTSWTSDLAGAEHSLATGATFGGLTESEFSFYERLTGESLEPFFEAPDNAAGGNDALETLISKMDTALNTFVVRIAVQSGPLSHYFETIKFDVNSDGFSSEAGHKISDVFHALLADAEQTSAPVAWLSEWKPFMDVFFADYSRGEGNLPVSYGYLVQQMMNAVERDPGGISVSDFADAFGIPEDLVSNGSGTVEGRNIEDIILIDGDEALVKGGSGADNYIVGKDFHSFELYDVDGALDTSYDTLRFSAHNASDIIATRDGIDLLLTDKVTGETIRITNEFEGRWPGPTISDASFDYGVDQIVFGDGTVWTKTDIALAVSKIDNASTTLIGTADIDVLQGGRGDDRLEGGGDTDIYRYSFGDGADTIHDQEDNAYRNDNDMLQFLDGIRISDLVFTRAGASNDLTISIKGHAGDQITIEGLFAATYTGVFGTWYQNRIEAFTFDDGSSLSFDQLASLVLKAYSTSGDDNLFGMNRQDVLIAGKGNDYVSGGNESDTYVFRLGDGQDVYQDQVTNILSGTEDTLVFGTGISSEDIVFSRIPGDPNSLVLTIAGTQDSVTLLNQYAGVYASVYGDLFFDQIETVRFTDEPDTHWTAAQMAEMALAAERTSGSDTIYGFDVDDVIDGGAGDDFLSGGNGDDTYLWGAGYGDDTIEEGGEDIQFGNDADTLIFQGNVRADDILVGRNQSENDLVITLKSTGETLTLSGQVWYTSINYHPDAIDRFEFSDGTVWTAADLRERYLVDAATSGNDTIVGFFSNDTINGGSGDDLLKGGDGSDEYVFGYGSGHDVIQETWSNVMYSDDDKVIFEPGISASDVSFSRIGNSNDLVVTLLSSGETLTIIGEFYTGNFDMNDVETFVFSDGTVTEDDLRELLLSSTSANETIYGFDKSDVFHYAAGGGNDTFVDDVNSGGQDRLVLEGLLQSDVTFSRDLNDLLMTVSSGKGGGVVRLVNSVNDYVDQGIELVEFADGTVLSRADLRSLALAGASTAGNDTIVGTGANDAIEGGLGDDVLNGGAGSDTYYYRRGDGNDVITEGGYFSNAKDRLVLNGIDPNEVHFERTGTQIVLVVAESEPGVGDGGRITLNGNGNINYDSGVETVLFDDGTVWTADELRTHYFDDTATTGNDTIVGFNANDTITGGRGNDVINGGEGADTYIYRQGDGHDVITEGGYFSSAIDKLKLIGIDQTQITFGKSGDNLILNIAETTAGADDGGSIALIGTGSPYYDSGVEQVIFDNGTIWTQDTMRVNYFADARTAGNDDITGFSTSDTISGGLGNDTLSGAGGNDVYLYSAGDGDDFITDSGGTDRLILSGINSTQASFSKVGGNTIIHFSNGASGDITIAGVPASSSDYGLEYIEFADGVVVSKADLIAELSKIFGTEGDDTIVGSSASDTIVGGYGDDVLNGGTGDDTYVYARGDGNDTITEPTDSYADVLKFAGINSTDITLTRNGNDLSVIVSESSPGAGDGGSILIKQTLDWYYGRGIDNFLFADGELWTIEQIRQKVLELAATSGNDTIVGFNTADTITGGHGDDVLNGGTGDDTYVYARGDGNDTITEPTDSYADVLKFAGINSTDITLTRNGNDLSVIVSESSPGAGDGGSILIKQTLDWYYGRGIDNFLFADGELWTIEQIRQKVLELAATSGNDTIVGFNTADTITGGHGDDVLNGGTGDDTYVYARGDGNDTITEPTDSYSDVLKLVDIDVNDVSIIRSGNDLKVIVLESEVGAGNGGSIYISQTVDNYYGRGIDKLQFEDGTIWQRSQILSAAGPDYLVTVPGTSGADILTGTWGNDVIRGYRGDDTLLGSAGSDVYVYSSGDGNDYLDDEAGFTDNTDVLVLTNLVRSDVTFARAGVNLVMTVTATGDTVTLDEEFYSEDDFWGIERIEFADGVSMNRDDIWSYA
jgi:Ca2+-binding RTX toxin-like protein